MNICVFKNKISPKVKPALAFLGLAVISTDVMAAGKASADIATLFWPTINFTLYLCLMVYLYRRFARPVLRNQKIEIDSAVVKAQNEYATLEREHEQLKLRLADITREKSEIVSGFEAEGRDLSNNVIAAANDKAERLLGDVRRRVESENQKMATEAVEKMLTGAIEQARARLSESFSEVDDINFIRSALSGSMITSPRDQSY